MLIHRYSHGIPRTISVICDNALVNGMALQRACVDQALVLEVCRDLRLVADEPALRVSEEPTEEAKPQSSTLGGLFAKGRLWSRSRQVG
jgi:hypothetical protein